MLKQNKNNKILLFPAFGVFYFVLEAAQKSIFEPQMNKDVL